MNSPLFSTVECLGYPLFVYKPWLDRGVVHGMTTLPLDLSDASLHVASLGLSEAFEFDSLLLPRQNHGATVVSMLSDSDWSARARDGVLLRGDEGDAVIARSDRQPAETGGRAGRYAIGVRTADCVPMIIEGRSPDGAPVWATIHAGWRGLACGVISQCLTEFSRRATPVTCVVFPCGGAEVYEVGGEVVEAIGTTAVFSPADPKGSEDKFLLNLSTTAAKQLSDAAPGATVVTADVCTISASVSSSSGKRSPLFHSYRRDGAKSGRNLTFVRL